MDGRRAGAARRGPGRHARYEAGGAATAPHRSRCPAGRSVGPRPCARKVNGRMEPENGRRQRRRLASRHARHVRPRARSIGRWSPPCTHAARYSGSRILGTGAGTLAWPGRTGRPVTYVPCSGQDGTGPGSQPQRARARSSFTARPWGPYGPTRLPALTCAIVYRPFAHARSQRRAAPRRAAHSKSLSAGVADARASLGSGTVRACV